MFSHVDDLVLVVSEVGRISCFLFLSLATTNLDAKSALLVVVVVVVVVPGERAGL